MKRQTSKLIKTTGSLNNWVMGNNATEPKVGEGATELLWSDRHAYEVMEVSKDGRTVKLQRYKVKRADNNGMSETQEWEYKELHPEVETIVWRNGAWRSISEQVVFVDPDGWGKPENNDCYDERGRLKFVAGKTKVYRKYPKISIIFGVRMEYYDFSF